MIPNIPLVLSLPKHLNVINIIILDINNYNFYHYYIFITFLIYKGNSKANNIWKYSQLIFTQFLYDELDAHVAYYGSSGHNKNIYYPPSNCEVYIETMFIMKMIDKWKSMANVRNSCVITQSHNVAKSHPLRIYDRKMEMYTNE